MKIGIIGLPQAGKKTLFEALTQHSPVDKDHHSNKPQMCIAEIQDPRLDEVAAMHKPKRVVRARIDIELLPKIEGDTIKRGDIFKDIADLDAICLLVRAFQDDSIYHINGSVDPGRDIDTVNSELILNDLLFIEKRLERIEHNLKVIKDEATLKEKDLMLKLKAHLEKELPLRLLDLDLDEKKTIASYPFITRKEIIIALNVSEEDLNKDDTLQAIAKGYQSSKMDIMQVCAKTEAEIARLENEQEKEEFLTALGIKEPAINTLTRLAIKALNLISFFTGTPDEVRHWTLASGASAPEAAGKIHTDMQRGFIRAEVIKYKDLVELKSEERLREAGRLYLKGKDYIVEDGDILRIRFNV